MAIQAAKKVPEEIEKAPFVPFEQEAAKFIRDPDRDPAENPRASRLLRDARSDMVSAARGDTRSVDDALLADYFHLSRIDPHRDDSATSPVLEGVTFARMIQATRDATDQQLEQARVFMRELYEFHGWARSSVELKGLAPEGLLDALRLLPLDFDTRSDDYDPGTLLMNVGMTLAFLATEVDRPQ